jgi:hypothetical protein
MQTHTLLLRGESRAAGQEAAKLHDSSTPKPNSSPRNQELSQSGSVVEKDVTKEADHVVQGDASILLSFLTNDSINKSAKKAPITNQFSPVTKPLSGSPVCEALTSLLKSPVTPPEELLKRQRYLKDWIGQLRARVENLESRSHLCSISSQSEFGLELCLPTEIVLTTQLLQGDIYISGSLNLHNQAAKVLNVDISFDTEILRILNHDSGCFIMEPQSKVE